MATRVFGEGRKTPGGIYSVRHVNLRDRTDDVQDDARHVATHAELDWSQPLTILSGADVRGARGFQSREGSGLSQSLHALISFVSGKPTIAKLSPEHHRRLAIAYGAKDNRIELYAVNDPHRDRLTLLRVCLDRQVLVSLRLLNISSLF